VALRGSYDFALCLEPCAGDPPCHYPLCELPLSASRIFHAATVDFPGFAFSLSPFSAVAMVLSRIFPTAFACGSMLG